MDIVQTNSLTNDKFAWRVSFAGAILLLVLLPIIRPETYLDIYKFIPDGIFVTLIVTVSSIIFASILGIFVGMGRSWNPILNKGLSIYVEVVRGIPLLVQLMYIYFVLGRLWPFSLLGRIGSAIFAMSFCYGAYMAEIVRAGLLSIPKGQIEAAMSLGMKRFQVYRLVIIPQAIRIIIPPFGNEFIALLKDSSLVSILAVTDLMRRAREYASVTFNYFEAFTVAALGYLVLTLFFSAIVAFMEKKIHPHSKRRKKHND